MVKVDNFVSLLHSGRPGQSFETQPLNTNYFTFRSLFGQKIGLRNHLGDIKVFDLIDI